MGVFIPQKSVSVTYQSLIFFSCVACQNLKNSGERVNSADLIEKYKVFVSVTLSIAQNFEEILLSVFKTIMQFNKGTHTSDSQVCICVFVASLLT